MNEQEALIELATQAPIAIATIFGWGLAPFVAIGTLVASVLGYTEARKIRKREQRYNGEVS